MVEIRRLLAVVGPWSSHDVVGALKWSYWRRRHQVIARACHYRRRTHA